MSRQGQLEFLDLRSDCLIDYISTSQNTFGHSGGEIGDTRVTFKWTSDNIDKNITFV